MNKLFGNFAEGTSTDPIQAQRYRTALRVLAIFLVLVTISFVSTLFTAIQTGQWHNYMLAADAVWLGATLGAAYQWTRQGQYGKAAFATISGFSISVVPVAIKYGGLGTLLSLVVVFMGIFFSIQLLSGRGLVWGLVGTLAGSALVTLTDTFFKQLQTEVQFVQNLWLIVAVVMTFSFLAFLLSQFRNYSIPAKLSASYLLLVLPPIAILVFFFTISTRQALQTQGQASLLSSSHQVAGTVDDFVNTNFSDLKIQALNQIFVDYLTLPASERPTAENGAIEKEVFSFLTSYSRKDPEHIVSYALLDSQGNDVADTYKDDIGLNKADRDYFKTAWKTGTPYASPVEISETTGKLSIYFSTPVFDETNRFLGVLRVRYDGSVLQQLIAKSNGFAGAQSFAVLLDENNILMAHGTQPSLDFKSIVPLAPQVLADLKKANRLPNLPADQLSTNLTDWKSKLDNSAQEPVFSTTLSSGSSDQSVVAVSKLATEPWLVAYTVPQETLYASATTATTTASVAFLIITALVAALALIITNQLSNPILGLTQTAQAISAGDFSAQAKVETNDEVGELAKTINTMTAQIRGTLASLDQRASQLATVAQVGTTIASILDLQRLLQEVVELTKDRFNLYHSHIYLLDDDGDNLVLAAGAGEPGRRMVQQGHSIPVSREQSLVARAARERQGITVNDVTQAPDFLSNPLLPNTRSELAVPMIVGGAVVGVFDIQSDQIGRFTEADINIQTTLAAQLAASIQNVRSFEQAKERAELEVQVSAISQKIQHTVSVEDALQTAVREIGAALGASRVKAHITSKPRD